jgi:glycine betaine/proline transport system substrate-binding protein
MRKLTLSVLSIVCSVGLLLSGCGSSATSGSSDQSAAEASGQASKTVTIGVTPWTSTVPPTYVAKSLLEKMGYQVKLQNADAGVVYAGLSKGDINVFMDAWLPDMHKNYMDKYGKTIDDVAVSYPNGELGWVVPSYVKGINSMADLKGKESLFDGKVYGIEEGAGMTMTSKKMIKAYGLNLQYQSSSEAGMLSQAKKMIAQKKPILFLGWRPHTMFAKWDLKILKDPKGFFKTSEVHVLTNKGFDKQAPDAYNFLKHWKMPVKDIESMILKIENGAKPEEVAKQWIAEHPEQVKQMMAKNK